MTVLSLFVFVAMLLVAGIAVDMMRHENERVRMQGAADRAVVAATGLRATPYNPTPEQILTSYLNAEGLGQHIGGRIQVVENAATGRTVTAVPAGRVPTLFMSMLGVNDLPLATIAEANEAIGNVPDIELVMVLDISISMIENPGGGPRRIDRMQQAVAQLAEVLLDDAPLGRVAITLVPYDSWVVPTPGFLNFFTNQTGSGACMDFSTYDVTVNSFDRPIERNACPTDSWRQISPFLHTSAAVTARVNQLRPWGNTSIDLGVHVGSMFFDPTINPAIRQLISNGMVDPVFANRPFAWDRPNTERVMLILTDGNNYANVGRGRGLSRAWGLMRQLLARELNINEQNEQLDANTVATCLALHGRGVRIYTVAFEAPSRGVSLMQLCASSPNHFFQTSGAGLVDVFRGIGNHINSQALRLTR